MHVRARLDTETLIFTYTIHSIKNLDFSPNFCYSNSEFLYFSLSKRLLNIFNLAALSIRNANPWMYYMTRPNKCWRQRHCHHACKHLLAGSQCRKPAVVHCVHACQIAIVWHTDTSTYTRSPTTIIFFFSLFLAVWSKKKPNGCIKKRKKTGRLLLLLEREGNCNSEGMKVRAWKEEEMGGMTGGINGSGRPWHTN